MNYDFAERLIELRRQHNMSQEDLAKKMGVSRQAISKWERAESTPDVTNLVTIANLYEISLDELVHGESTAGGTPVPATVAEPAEATDPTGSTSAASEAPSPAPESSTPPTPETTDAAAPPPQGAPYTTTPPPPPEGVAPVQPTDPPTPEQAKKRNPLYTFPYPVLVVMIYLFIGFCFGLWHPGWVIFFTIPFYYWIASVITHDPNYIARHQDRNH